MSKQQEQKSLRIPAQGAEVQEIDGVKYLITRLDEARTCDWYVAEIKKGKPVTVPLSKRCHIIGLLKEKRVFTKSRTIVPGQWVLFTPCEPRPFRE